MSLAAARSRPGVAVVLLLLVAPVSAEFLSGYLPATGHLLEMLFSLVFLAPLYGGAALLIRETAVRRGLGWPGVLLLAAAFGALQAGVVDQSVFTGVDTGTDLDDTFAPTLVEPLGISAAMTTQWVGGHVVLSIGVPLALVGLWAAPELRRRPWLRRRGFVLVLAAFLLVSALIATDTTLRASPRQTASAAAVVVLLVAVALGPWGRPVERNLSGSTPSPRLLLVGGLVGQLLLDLSPAGWFGTVAVWLALIATAVAVRRLARTPQWGTRHIAALGAGAFAARAAIGFLSPVVPGVDPQAKLAQAALFAAVAVGIVVAVLHVRSPAYDAGRDRP